MKRRRESLARSSLLTTGMTTRHNRYNRHNGLPQTIEGKVFGGKRTLAFAASSTPTYV